MSMSRSSIKVLAGTLEVAEIPGHAHVAHHRPADVNHLAAMGHGGIQAVLHPVHVGGEAGDDHPLLALDEDPFQGGTDVAFSGDEAGDLRVRRVDHEQVDPRGAQSGEGPEIGQPTVQRQLVHLEVAGVQDQRRPAYAQLRPARRGSSG